MKWRSVSTFSPHSSLHLKTNFHQYNEPFQYTLTISATHYTGNIIVAIINEYILSLEEAPFLVTKEQSIHNYNQMENLFRFVDIELYSYLTTNCKQ